MGLVEEVFELLAQGFVHGGWQWIKVDGGSYRFWMGAIGIGCG